MIMPKRAIRREGRGGEIRRQAAWMIARHIVLVRRIDHDGVMDQGSLAGGAPMTGDSRMRASDADRDRAAAQLLEHLAAGRLSAGEHGERVSRALRARTLGELGALMADLPGLDQRPGPPGYPAGPGRARTAHTARPGGAGRTRLVLSQDATALAGLSVIVVAYLATGLLTGIWWIPWALAVMPVVRMMHRRGEPAR
jgi:Domain of unknown function (DUF1707)